MPRGFGHVFGVRSEKLHADWTFDLVKIEIFAGTLVAEKNSFGRNEFGYEHIGAEFFAKLSEDLVRHPSHGREIEWKAGKPWQYAIADPLLAMTFGVVHADRSSMVSGGFQQL